MNQKALAVLTLVGAAVAVSTNTNHTAVDVGSGYASVGRRQMKALGSILMGAGNTSSTVKLQDNTTSTATDSGWADITGGAFAALTTQGELTPIHVATNKRYIRAVSTNAGTTISVQPLVYLLVEDRDP